MGDRWKSAGVFLDRDGVINEVVFRNGKPASPRSMDEFVVRPGVAAAVERLRDAGLRVLVATNQPDVARGLLAPDTLEGMTARLVQAVPVDGVRACRHDDADECACRKPKPGLLTRLARDWNLELRHSFMVGDSWKDMEAARRAGCRAILLSRSYNAGTAADHRVSELDEAVALILDTVSEV